MSLKTKKRLYIATTAVGITLLSSFLSVYFRKTEELKVNSVVANAIGTIEDKIIVSEQDTKRTRRSRGIRNRSIDSLVSSLETRGDISIKTHPVFGPDGSVYFGSLDGFVYAFDKDEVLEWEFNAEGSVDKIAIDKNGYLHVVDHRLVAIDGQEEYQSQLYKLDCNGNVVDIFPADSLIAFCHVFDKEGYLCFGQERKLFLMSLEEGTVMDYKFESSILDNPYFSENGDKLYFGTASGDFYSLDLNSGLDWCFKTNDFIGASPYIADNGNIYFGDYGISRGDEFGYHGYLYALNQNGRLLWSLETKGPFLNSPSVGKDGTIFAFSDSLYAVNPDDGSLIWSYFEDSFNSNFCLSVITEDDDSLYICSGKGLIKIKNGLEKGRFKLESLPTSLTRRKDGKLYVAGIDGKVIGVNPSDFE